MNAHTSISNSPYYNKGSYKPKPLLETADLYRSAHDKVRATRGRACTYPCAAPGCDKQALDWALVADPKGEVITVICNRGTRRVSTSTDDYQPLCRRCHIRTDSARRGRKRQERCNRGHPLSGPDADVRVVEKGGRVIRTCRACIRWRNRARQLEAGLSTLPPDAPKQVRVRKPKPEPKRQPGCCVAGHPLSGPEAEVRIYHRKNGGTTRICRRCEYRRTNEKRARQRAAKAAQQAAA